MSGMRWADSDSESEEEYIPPSQQGSQELPQAIPVLGDPPAPTHRPPPDQGGRGGRGGGNRHSNHDDRGGGGGAFGAGGRGWDRAGRGRGGGDSWDRGRGASRPHQPSTDWKQMAKESSRFSGEHSQVDGSAWMAQRRAKREQEEKDRNEEDHLRRQKAEEEKRERRKDQVSALKSAVVQIKEAPPSSPKATTSLQRAAMSREPLPSLPASVNRKPTAILSRVKSHDKTPEPSHNPQKDEGRWPRAAFQAGSDKPSREAKSAEKQLYSLTISGPPTASPADGLQPRETSTLPTFDKGEGDNGRYQLEYGDDGIAVNKEGKSVNSGGSNKQGDRSGNQKSFYPGRSGRGRGGRKTNDTSGVGEDASVGSSVSRGSGRGRGPLARGGRGGRGRGRHEPDSSRGGPGRHEASGRGGRGRHEHTSGRGSPEHDTGRGRGRQGRDGRSRGRGGRAAANSAEKGTD